MTVEIYRALPRLEWAPSTPQYYFRPEVADHEPYALIDVPEGWILVGEPQPLLVCRLNASDFRTMTATDALYYSLSRVNGFSVSSAPSDGVPATLGSEVVQHGLDPEPSALDGPRRRGLPRPADRNGKK